MDLLKEECTEENLWKCIVVFQEYLFYTSSGLPFQYTLRIGGISYVYSLLWRFGIIMVPENIE